MSSQTIQRSVSMSTNSTSAFVNEKGSRQKQQIMAPPVSYDLKKGTGQQVIDHLNNLNIITNAAAAAGPGPGPIDENINRFIEVLRLRQKKSQYTTFGYIPAPPDSYITRQVIGKDGYFFKMTTTLCQCDFIWHDRQNNVFLFWGSSTFKVVKALNSIRWRIHKIYTIQQAKQQQAKQQVQATTTQYNVEEISDDESDDDMPGLISHEEIQEQMMRNKNLDKYGYDIDEND